MIRLKKYIGDKPVLVIIAKVIVGALALILLFSLGCFVIAMFIFGADIAFSKKHTYTNLKNYSKYIGNNAVPKYSSKWGMDESIFPEEITEQMQVDEFSFTYYNPWDAEYVGYLTVTYSQDEFNNELERLSEKSHDHFIGLYKITGEPDNYSVLAINSDSDFGFVYAITPDTVGTSITYVEVIFPSKLEMRLDDYLPKEYQLKGMDVTQSQ